MRFLIGDLFMAPGNSGSPPAPDRALADMTRSPAPAPVVAMKRDVSGMMSGGNLIEQATTRVYTARRSI